jgi:hypothetical protein
VFHWSFYCTKNGFLYFVRLIWKTYRINSYLRIGGRKCKITHAAKIYLSKGVFYFRPQVRTTFYARLH